MDTVGLLVKLKDKGNSKLFAEQLTNLSREFGYSLAFSTEESDNEVREGIELLQTRYDGDFVVLIQYSLNKYSPYSAYGINSDLIESSNNNKKSRFEEYLRLLTPILREYCSDVWFFFAFEWEPSDRVRYLDGDLDNLMKEITTPFAWYLPLLDLTTNEMYPNLDLPLVFKLQFHK
jgi:hypothetical protein